MSLCFFICFLLPSQLFRLMRIVTKKGVEITVLFELFGHIAISFIPMAVPLSLLFAMIYTLGKLSEDSEIVAIRAMGVNKITLFAPFLIIGIISAVSVFSLNRNIIPYSKGLFKNTVIALTSEGFLSDIKKEQFYTEIPGIILFAEDVKNSGQELEKVFIKIKSKSNEKIIMAQKGNLIKNQDHSTTGLNLRLDLYNGNIVTINSEDEMEKIIFDKYEFPITSGSENKFVNKDSMRSNDELLKNIEATRKYIESIKKSKLKPQRKEEIINDKEGSIRRSNLEYWSRFNVPIQCLAFVLLGFVFGVKKGRGKNRNTSVFILIFLIIYYALFFTGVSMVKKGELPAELVVFLPTTILLIVGAHYYRKLDWSS